MNARSRRTSRRRSAILPALLVAALSAGCADFFGMCGPTDVASWQQPGLYAKLASSGRETSLQKPSGLDLENDPRGLEGALLRSVSWSPMDTGQRAAGPDTRPREHPTTADIVWDRRATISVTTNIGADEAKVPAALRTLLENVSAAPERWDAWERELLANRSESGWSSGPAGEPVPFLVTYRVDVEGPYNTEALRAKVNHTDDAIASLGQRTVRDGEWLYVFHAESRTLTEKIPRGELRLTVDAFDYARASIEHKDGSNKTASLAALNRTLSDLGADAPAITVEHFGTLVC